MHLSIIHNYIKRKDSFLTEIRNELEEKESQIETNSIKTNSKPSDIICNKTFACTKCETTFTTHCGEKCQIFKNKKWRTCQFFLLHGCILWY